MNGLQRIRAYSGLILAMALFATMARAGEANVVDVKVTQRVPGHFDFAVTVAHGDTGWDHYADRWQVLAPDGTVLGERILLHPHENEQPFTRSLTGVSIPDDIVQVTVRAGDKVHEFGGTEMQIVLPDRAGG